MKQLKVTPSIKTYELLFSLFGNVNAPYETGNILSQAEVAKRINALEDDMMRNGIQHSYISIRNLVSAFLYIRGHLLNSYRVSADPGSVVRVRVFTKFFW